MNKFCAQSLQLCPTLCNSMDCSPSGSSVHSLLQARLLAWVNARETKERPRIEWSLCRMLERQTRVCKELSLVGCSNWEAVMTTRTEVQSPERTKGTGPGLDREYSRTQRKRWALICTQPTSLWWQINLHRAPCTDSAVWTNRWHARGGPAHTLKATSSLYAHSQHNSYAHFPPPPPPGERSHVTKPCHFPPSFTEA